jgi:hypothetical protein
VIWARVAGAVTGAAERMASVSVSPDCWWKCWLSRVCPGSLPVKLFWAGAPNLVHSVTRQATPTTQVTRVSQRCRKQTPPRVPSGPGPVRRAGDAVEPGMSVSYEPAE